MKAMLETGRQIGPYRVVRLLGKGGMAEVYEVENERLGAHFALKVFTLDHGEVEFLRKRFQVEGRLLARLSHPRIVRVYDRRIVGHPDIVIPKCRALIEIRGCFWHHHGWEWDGRKLVQTAVCPSATAPKSNRAFWNAKFRRNVRRDAEHERAWAEDGWNLIVIWECALKSAREREKTFAFILRHLAKWGAGESSKQD